MCKFWATVYGWEKLMAFAFGFSDLFLAKSLQVKLLRIEKVIRFFSENQTSFIHFDKILYVTKYHLQFKIFKLFGDYMSLCCFNRFEMRRRVVELISSLQIKGQNCISNATFSCQICALCTNITQRVEIISEGGVPILIFCEQLEVWFFMNGPF